MQVIQLLASIGRIPPEAWDAIIPQWYGTPARLAAVALNPQPLPPAEAFIVAAARMAHEVATEAINAQVGGGSPRKFVGELVDDWCATPWPRKWPWPWPGPRDGAGPLPDPWAVDLARISGAIVFANYGTRLGKSELSDAFLSGAERLAEAVGGKPGR
jgi:hypothetical protein